jgi:phytoene synthase
MLTRSSDHTRAHAAARHVIHRHSKSFALAAQLLPPAMRDDARVLYAYCRRADDAIDLAARAQQAGALSRLYDELEAIYRQRRLSDPIAVAFQSLVFARDIPREYPEALLLGMHMDVAGTHYASLSDLLCYAYRVAGTVGLMMCHVMGVRSERALVHAAHLGIAMQLTNIARDVHEDWERGRLYLPEALCAEQGVPALHGGLGFALPRGAATPVARATSCLLDHAERYYRSADAGMAHLSPRCAFAIRAARMIYAEIGRELRYRDCDPRASRAIVPRVRKLLLIARAAAETFMRLPRALRAPLPRVPLTRADELACRSVI